MKVILFETVPNLGVRGSICDVAPGYFRNFLSPKGIAVEATEANVLQLQDKIKKLERQAQEEIKAARTEAEKLSDLTLTFQMKAGEGDKLFGSITNVKIAEELEKKGFTIDRHKIAIPEPIKQIGEHTVHVKIHTEVVADIKVVVEKEASETEGE